MEDQKKKTSYAQAWKEARKLVWERRGRLGLGLLLLTVNRLSGFVLPTSSKYVIDDVLGEGRQELLKQVSLPATISLM